MIIAKAGSAVPDEFMTQLASYREAALEYLRTALPAREPRRYLYDLIRGFLARPGKGLRPALCLATCCAYGGQAQHALPAAAALELLHNALLVHDDVEDESEYRRDEPTLHTTHGIPLAINAGDAMNALTMTLLMSNVNVVGPALSWRVLEEFNHLLIESLEGQAMELGWIRENNFDVGEDDYLVMILKKTCWYSFIHPCRIGALLAGQHDLDRFNRFGYLTGAAFQIQDDVLNLVGESCRYGKEIKGDLWEGKRTLVLTHAIKRVSGRDRERLLVILSKPRKRRMQREIDWMYGLLKQTGSIDNAVEAARALAAAATREFETAYSTALDGPDTQFLRKYVAYMVERDM